MNTSSEIYGQYRQIKAEIAAKEAELLALTTQMATLRKEIADLIVTANQLVVLGDEAWQRENPS